MVDKSTAIPVGVCENVPVVVANFSILTDFVILDMHVDDNMSVIIGRPFLNTTRAVIDCSKGKLTSHVNGNAHTIYFLRKPNKGDSLNSTGNVMTIEDFEFPIQVSEKKYETIMIGTIPIKVEVT